MQAPPEDANPLNRAYEGWYARTPVVCRALCLGLVACYAFSWILDLQRALETVPFRVVRRFELWRLLLAPCVGNSLLSTAVACMSLGDGVGPRLEQSWGSVRLALATATAVALINGAFCALCYLATLATGSMDGAFAATSGSWPVLMCLITIECLSSPDGTRQLPCFPVAVPRDRYPLALLLLLLLFGADKVALSLGVAYGYAYAKGYLELLKPRPALVHRCETSSALSCLTGDAAFVSAHGSLGAAGFTVSGGDWAPGDPENPSTTRRGFESMLDSLRAALPQEAPPPPGGPGRVLGGARVAAPATASAAAPLLEGSRFETPAAAPAAAPLTPAQTPPHAPQRTAAANREAILAAAERRANAS